MIGHTHRLDWLVAHLEKIDESPKNIAWIMREGIWLPDGEVEKNKLCDLIIDYYTGHWSLVELKSGLPRSLGKNYAEEQRNYAIEQLRSSMRFIEEQFKAKPSNVLSKIVYYDIDHIEYEVIKC